MVADPASCDQMSILGIRIDWAASVNVPRELQAAVV
jgi:hypothetical protein